MVALIDAPGRAKVAARENGLCLARRIRWEVHCVLETLDEKEAGPMFPIRGLYEVAIRVKDLARAEKFYRDVLELEVGIRDDTRNWIFLRAGGDAGMIVLQEDKGDWPQQHFAFTIDEADIEKAAALLREKGIAVEGPVIHEWMNGASLYFDDPDGHALELLANLSEPPAVAGGPTIAGY